MKVLEAFVISASSLLSTALAFGAETPTVSELESAYRQNLLSLAPFSVEWEEVRTEYQAAIETDKYSLWLLDQLLSSGDLVEEHLRQLKESQERLNGETSPEAIEKRLAPKTRRRFFWTDHKSFQLRWLPTEKDLGASLEPAEVSAGALLSSYPEIRILSWSPKNNPRLRLWMGTGRNGKSPSGLVTSSGVESAASQVRFLPMGKVHEEWAALSAFSPLDRVFNLNEGWVRETVTTTIGDERAVLLRCINEAAVSDTKMIRRLKVWFVPSKGFLPVKMETSSVSSAFAPEEADEFARVTKVVSVSEIREFGASFYPAVIEEQHFTFDPKWRFDHPGDVPHDANPPLVMARSARTEVISFSPDRSLDDRTVALPFPDGTRYLNEDEHHWYMEGLSKAEFDRQLQEEFKRSTPRIPRSKENGEGRTWTGIRQSVVWFNVIAVAIILVVILYRRKRAQG